MKILQIGSKPTTTTPEVTTTRETDKKYAVTADSIEHKINSSTTHSKTPSVKLKNYHSNHIFQNRAESDQKQELQRKSTRENLG